MTNQIKYKNDVRVDWSSWLFNDSEKVSEKSTLRRVRHLHLGSYRLYPQILLRLFKDWLPDKITRIDIIAFRSFDRAIRTEIVCLLSGH